MRKHSISILTIISCLLILAAPAFAGGGQEDDRTITIGISKIVAHPALDAVEQGIQDELAEQGFEDVNYDLQNANGDANTAMQIANKFEQDNVDVAVGIATPTAQALVSAIDDAPIVFSAVTDPVDAGIVGTLDGDGSNVTGLSDMTPVQQQIEFLASLADIQSLGHVYSSSEANAVALAAAAEAACEELGIEFVVATVQNSSEVRQATQSIVDRVDGIYISTDNTVVSALNSVTDVAMNAGIPVMSADPSSAETYDVIAAWGFDYYSAGRITGRMIADILNGADPGTMPTAFITEPSDVNMLLNLDVANQLGISFPQNAIENASTLVRDGEVIRQ
ncbi:MAG: ABC transporter substrate-binding protein [Spirochaetia bacterium]